MSNNIKVVIDFTPDTEETKLKISEMPSSLLNNFSNSIIDTLVENDNLPFLAVVGGKLIKGIKYAESGKKYGLRGGLTNDLGYIDDYQSINVKIKSKNDDITFNSLTFYFDNANKQWATVAIVDGKTIYNDDNIWTIRFKDRKNEHLVEFKSWNKPNYNFIISALGQEAKNKEFDWEWIKQIEITDQISPDQVEPYFNTLVSEATIKFFDKNGELLDYVNDEIINYEAITDIYVNNYNVYRGHVDSFDNYEKNQKSLSIKLSTSFNKLDGEFSGIPYVENVTLYDILEIIRKRTELIFDYSKKILVTFKGEQTYLLIESYLKMIKFQRFNMEKLNYREALALICRIAMLSVGTENNKIVFYTARPRIASQETAKIIEIKPNCQMDDFSEVILSKNNYRGCSLNNTIVNFSKYTNFRYAAEPKKLNRIEYVEFNGQNFIILTTPGFVYTSLDGGITWTNQSIRTAETVGKTIAFAPTNKIYIFYDKVYSTRDGKTYEIDSNFDSRWIYSESVSSGENILLSSSRNSFTMYDGNIFWTGTHNIGDVPSSSVYGKGVFVLASIYGSYVVISRSSSRPGGWAPSEVRSIKNGLGSRIWFCNDIFYMMNNEMFSVYSYDLITWKQIVFYDVDVSGFSLENLQGISYSTEKGYVAIGKNRIYYSADGIHFVKGVFNITKDNYISWMSLTYNASSKKFITIGYEHTPQLYPIISFSEDGFYFNQYNVTKQQTKQNIGKVPYYNIDTIDMINDGIVSYGSSETTLKDHLTSCIIEDYSTKNGIRTATVTIVGSCDYMDGTGSTVIVWNGENGLPTTLKKGMIVNVLSNKKDKYNNFIPQSKYKDNSPRLWKITGIQSYLGENNRFKLELREVW